MAIMANTEPTTLKEVQLRLRVPQHVLIHLCEKGVIVPDFAETLGRGKRREFSKRNLFEFAVALTLRELELSVATTALVVRLLRSFERATARALPGFVLLEHILEKRLELTLYLLDGRHLVVDARGGTLGRPVMLGVDIGSTPRDPNARPRIEKLRSLPEDFDGRLELNLSRIARKFLQSSP